MLRINLLPPYIYEGAKKRNVTILWTVIVLAVAGAALGWWTMLNGQATKIAEETEALRPQMQEAQRTQEQADKIMADSQTIRGKADFVKEARKYVVTTYPTRIQNVVNYTISRVLYSSMMMQGQTIQMTAYAPSLADVGHYIMWMENNPDIREVAITLNSIPPFTNPQAQVQTGTRTTTTFPGSGRAPSTAVGSMPFGPPFDLEFGLRSPNPGASIARQPVAGLRPPSGGGHDFTVTLTLVNPIPSGPRYPPVPTQQPGMGGFGGGVFGGPMGPMGPMAGPMGPMAGPMGPAMGLGAGATPPSGATGAVPPGGGRAREAER